MYACAIDGSPIDVVLQRLPWVVESAAKAPPFVRQLCQTAHAHLDEIDARLAAVVHNWTPDRIAWVDRALLRLAVCELLFFPDIDARVTLDEYIELAKDLGDSKSPAFVNGVLDRLLSDNLRPAASPEKDAQGDAQGGSDENVANDGGKGNDRDRVSGAGEAVGD